MERSSARRLQWRGVSTIFALRFGLRVDVCLHVVVRRDCKTRGLEAIRVSLVSLVGVVDFVCSLVFNQNRHQKQIKAQAAGLDRNGCVLILSA